MKKVIRRTLECVAGSLAIFMLWKLVTAFVPAEPVATDVYAEGFRVHNGWTYAKVYGVKGRDCELIEKSWAGLVRPHLGRDEWHEVPFVFLDDPTPGNSRPPGHHSFGVWGWKTTTSDRFIVTIAHICDGEKVTTVMGPFNAFHLLPSGD